MKILLFGASGTAGGAVLRACLAASSTEKSVAAAATQKDGASVVDGAVEEVRAIVRKPLGQTHAKLREFVHANYADYAPVADAFRGVDACLFCLGVSVTQVSKEEFVKISHDYAIAAARTLKAECPAAAFHYISGAGTRADSRAFWSKVKGQTENELMALIAADCWRPAFIDAPASASVPKMYSITQPLLRLLKPFQSLYVAGEDLGRAMLQATRENLRRRVIENAEIRALAARFRA